MRLPNLLSDRRMYRHVSTEEPTPPRFIDAGEVLDKVLAGMGLAIQDSGATVSRTDLPQICMHEFQLEQVLQNLVGNAIRYRGALPPCISIAAEQSGEEWLFSVRDNGIGIDPEYKEQIFGIFKRLHSASEYPGTGMGLAICQRVIERVGGRIWVESEPGRGSTFYFTIPRRKCGGETSAQRAVPHSAH